MHDQTFADERAILNTLSNFPRVVDRKQWDRVGDVFADDITFNYGDGQEQAGMTALLLNFRKFHDKCSAMQHLLGSIQIEVDGDAAITRAYVQARHKGVGDKEHLVFDTHGEYTDRWERRPEGWRIVRRDARWDLFSGDASVLFS